MYSFLSFRPAQPDSTSSPEGDPSESEATSRGDAPARSAGASEPPSSRESSRTARALLAVRLVLSVHVLWFCFHRWAAHDAAVRALEGWGFPAPYQWMNVALLAGGVGALLVMEGRHTRWGTALLAGGLMPIKGVFSAMYTSPTEALLPAPLLVAGVIAETLLMVGTLFVLFLRGGGQYTAGYALRVARTRIETLVPRIQAPRSAQGSVQEPALPSSRPPRPGGRTSPSRRLRKVHPYALSGAPSMERRSAPVASPMQTSNLEDAIPNKASSSDSGQTAHA
jgi:uncharacterized membrane protein YphA (DoxX/SURF4 family)